MIQQASHIYKEKPFSYYDETLQQIIHGIFDLVLYIMIKSMFWIIRQTVSRKKALINN